MTRGYPDLAATMANYEKVHAPHSRGKCRSAYVQEEGSLIASLVKMALGAGLGFEIESANVPNFDVASLVIGSTREASRLHLPRPSSSRGPLLSEWFNL